MVNTQKLVEYIESAPFPRAEKDRLITLACVANEEHQRHIYLLVKKFTESVSKERKTRMKNFVRFIRLKGEEIVRSSEARNLTTLEHQIQTIT